MSASALSGGWPRTCLTTTGGGFVLSPHQRERIGLAEVAAPGLPDPVGIGVLERAFGERVEERADPVADAAEHGVRERDGALEPGAADELDRLVHGRVARHPVEIAELVGAKAQRCANGRIELAHGPLAQRLDRVIERSHPLDRAVREPPRERRVALVEPRRGRAERPIGIRVVLEDATQHLVGGLARRCDAHRSPRRNSS